MSLNSSCRAQNADCAEEDRAALLDFKAGIVQDPTGALQTWTGNDCCRWNGLLCDTHNGRVVNLILNADQGNSREYMSGTLSDSIGNLSYLNKFIIFSWKYIGGTIPSSISGLSALTHLSLDNNNLTCSIPSAIADLPQLQFLSLSGNRLTGAIPQSIGNLQGLTALYLDSNQLSSSIPSSIGNLSRLSVLALNNNLFSDPIPESVGALASLSALDISNNFLSGLTYHGKIDDVWALGVTLYYMVLGSYPFIGDSLQGTYDKIVHDSLVLPKDMNPALANLLEGLLCKDPKKRMNLEAVARHPWVMKDFTSTVQVLGKCE